MILNQLKTEFINRFGGDGQGLRVFRAPGRVNLIGEHIDYNGGRVLPAALTLATTIVLRPLPGRTVRMAATDLPQTVELDLDQLDTYHDLRWGNYQAGVLYELAQAGYTLQGCEMLYDDTVPHGSGLSSSAAIEVATALATATLASPDQPDLVDIALLAQRAENNYVGVSCGIMDQFASALGRADNAILLDCATLEYRYVPLYLADCCLVIGNTKKPRSLAASKYNERRAECFTALTALRTVQPGLTNLCQLSPAEFAAAASAITDATVRRRSEHVVAENDRVSQAVAALDAGDLIRFGQLMTQSHQSLRDLYEVTGTELDTLFEEALKQPGVLGSRMTGAGFGGCTVSLVEKNAADRFISEVGDAYRARTGLTPEFYCSDIGDGCREII